MTSGLGYYHDPSTCMVCALQSAPLTVKSYIAGGSTVMADLAKLVPNGETEVPCPSYTGDQVAVSSDFSEARLWCAEPHQESVFGMIIHLNDTLRWTREEIADWLETLDVDLSFGDPIESTPEKPGGPTIFMDVEGAVPPPDVYKKFIVSAPKSGKSFFEYSANDVALYAGTMKLIDLMKKTNLTVALDSLSTAFDECSDVSVKHAAKFKTLPTRPGSQNYLKLKEKDRERSRRRTR